MLYQNLICSLICGHPFLRLLSVQLFLGHKSDGVGENKSRSHPFHVNTYVPLVEQMVLVVLALVVSTA